jgi:hypothetical protein
MRSRLPQSAATHLRNNKDVGNIMSKRWILGAALAATATAALATVTFDATTGTGFVGKGDVQLAFGYNNAAMQSQANNVVFTYTATTDTQYEVVCEWDTGNKKIVHHVQTTKKSLSASTVADVLKQNRNNPQGSLTGFFLKGYGVTTVVTSGDGKAPPKVGDGCPGNSGLGAVTGVQLLSSVVGAGELTVANPADGKAPVVIWSSAAAL